MKSRIIGKNKTRKTILKTFVAKIDLEESNNRLNQHVVKNSWCVELQLALFEPFLSLESSVTIAAQEIAREVGVGNVKEIFYQLPGHAIYLHEFVNILLWELSLTLLKESDDRIGIHATLVHPATEEIVATIELEGGRLGGGI